MPPRPPARLPLSASCSILDRLRDFLWILSGVRAKLPGEVARPRLADTGSEETRAVGARVEDRIRCGKDTGFGRSPSRLMAINAAWLEVALTATDLLAFTQTMLLDGDLAAAEPKKIRYRLLHTAARITRGQRKIYLRLAKNWPWALALAEAFRRLRTIPLPT